VLQLRGDRVRASRGVVQVFRGLDRKNSYPAVQTIPQPYRYSRRRRTSKRVSELDEIDLIYMLLRNEHTDYNIKKSLYPENRESSHITLERAQPIPLTWEQWYKKKQV